MSIVSILVAIILFSVLILFHEFGHFLLAKMNGIIVDEFALGMGPRLLHFEKGGTTYALKLLPFGGSCMMRGEDGEDEGEGSFNHASVLGKISVVAAGPVFNFILAFVASLIVIGVVGYDPAEVTMVTEGSAAEQAGLAEGDVITKINGVNIYIGRDLYSYETFTGLDGSAVTISYLRDGEKHIVTYVPDQEEKYMLGFSYSADENPAEISSLTLNMPLYRAGLVAGDVITAVDGNEIASGEALSNYFTEHPLDGTSVEIRYESDGKEKTVTVTPEETTYVELGFYYNLAREKIGVIKTVKYSLIEMRYWIKTTLKSLQMLITGQVSVNDMSGPVGVVSIIGDTYEESQSEGMLMTWMNMLYLMILLSANLGIMNLLPIPALDGGRLVFLIIEGIRGKAVNREVEGMIHFVGLMLLMVLIVYVTYQDILKLF